MLDKYSYLKKDRENRNEKLKKKHEKEKAALVQASDKTTPEEFIKVWFCKKKNILKLYQLEYYVLIQEIQLKYVINSLRGLVSRVV